MKNMIEKVIYLEGIEPVNVYGINNIRLNKLKDYYPKLKIIARGNEVKVQGDENEINVFEDKLEMIIEYFLKFKQLSDNEFESLLQGEGELLLKKREDTDDALVYGNNSKPIMLITSRFPLFTFNKIA